MPRFPRLRRLKRALGLGRAAFRHETAAGWVKAPGNPALGGALGTCFDAAALKDEDQFRLWFSWRPQKSIALAESMDGTRWGEPAIVLGPASETDWEEEVNRPVVVRRPDGYHLWYTGQAQGRSWIGHAAGPDGRTWTRTGARPVLSADQAWEKGAVMCPDVHWDEAARCYRMWYSAGDQYEPDALGYAASPDGLTWEKHPANPVFRPEPNQLWERHKVTACQVIPRGDEYWMFYIGFADEHSAQIGLARSRDGIHDWQRHPANPILGPGRKRGDWDYDAVYKPTAVFDAGQWRLWYNGRREHVEQIGLATHDGEDLWAGVP